MTVVMYAPVQATQAKWEQYRMYDYVVKELPQAIQSLPGLDISKVCSLYKIIYIIMCTDILQVHTSPNKMTTSFCEALQQDAQCQANCTCPTNKTLVMFARRLQSVGTAWAVMEP